MLSSSASRPDRDGSVIADGREQVALVLGGGNALGAYLAGAYEHLHEQGVRPDRIVGASIGAVTGAILAGSPPERRLARLEEFWAEAALHTIPAMPSGLRGRQVYNGAHVALAAALGRPSIFGHRYPGLWSILPGMPAGVSARLRWNRDQVRAQLRDLMHSLYRRYPVGSFLVSPSRSISLDPTLTVVELAHGQAVRCELDGTRAHDRCVGVCYLEGRDIAEAIVSEGLARDCPRFRGGRVCQGGGSGGGRWRDDRAELRPARVLPAEIA